MVGLSIVAEMVVASEQAAIAREIYQRYADGEAPRSICDDLDARGIS